MNSDLPQTRWDGIEAATGDYVILVDGDDYVDNRMAELLYNKAVETDSDMVVCNHWLCTPHGLSIREMTTHEPIDDGDNIRNDIINLNVPVNVWCKLIKRSLFTDNDIVWPVKGYAEDVVVSTVTAYYAKRIDRVAEPLYYYRYNPHSYSRGMDEQTRMTNFESYLANWHVLYDFMVRERLLDKYEIGVFKGKMRVKKHLLPLTNKLKYRRLYFNTFPEVDRAYMWGTKNRKPTYRERVWVMAVWLGLYPRMRRRLYSKRFHPRKEWLS